MSIPILAQAIFGTTIIPPSVSSSWALMGKRAHSAPCAGLKSVAKPKRGSAVCFLEEGRCKYCTREAGTECPITGVIVEFRGPDVCYTCTRVIAKDATVRAKAKSGLLLKECEKDRGPHLAKVEAEDAAASSKIQKFSNKPLRTVTAVSHAGAEARQVVAIFWPSQTFEVEEGYPLPADQIKTCQKYGIQYEGCWRKKGIDQLAIGAITFTNVKGERLSDEVDIAKSDKAVSHLFPSHVVSRGGPGPRPLPPAPSTPQKPLKLKENPLTQFLEALWRKVS